MNLAATPLLVVAAVDEAACFAAAEGQEGVSRIKRCLRSYFTNSNTQPQRKHAQAEKGGESGAEEQQRRQRPPQGPN